MDRIRLIVAACGISSCLVMVSCGGGNRMLDSISITPAKAIAQNGKAQFVATGMFSSSPTVVTPLQVNWSGPPVPAADVCAPVACGGGISSNGLVSCGIGYTGTVTITASAPRDPTLPLSAQNVPMVTAKALVTCPTTTGP